MQFAAIMETLGNEALGKMMNIVDEAELESESRRPQTSFLNILRNASIGRSFCDQFLNGLIRQHLFSCGGIF